MHRFPLQALLVAAVTASAALTACAQASATTEFAASASYTGTVTNVNGSIGSFATSEGGYAIDPFFPPYTQAASGSYPAILTTVGSASSQAASTLTLQFATPFDTSANFYLGIYSSVGLINVNNTPGGQPQALSTGTLSLSTPSEAIVSVSTDGTHFITLNNGQPIVFDNPTNAYTTVDDTVVSSSNYVYVSPKPAASGRTPQYAAATPFLGNINDFAGQTESGILSDLKGTAGGTWLDLSSTGLSTVKYVEFTVPAGDSAFINAVALSNDQPVVVPEPAALGLLFVPVVGLLLAKRRWDA